VGRLRFRDRSDAGRRLAAELPALDRPIVLALPRGGVPVAAAVARAIAAPLDVFVVRKLGVPAQPELAMGAVASCGVRVLNEDVIRAAGVSVAVLERVTARERATVESRELLYRGDRLPPELTNRDVILVDDGLATGATMRAAAAGVLSKHPHRIVVAVPVAPAETVLAFGRDRIEIVYVHAPRSFRSVGSWYDDFAPVTDDAVTSLLRSLI
jgi:predicted phosphoribosyltransferase